MPNYPIGVTKTLGTWSFQSNHVERILDNATYDAAHPDDTLILAGPARKGIVQPGRASPRTLMALGMFQNFGIQTQVPVMPVMAIGSGRSFFLRGKSQSNWTIQRAMINGRNLLRALYHNAIEAGVDPSQFDDAASLSATSQYFINLDSELYYIPLGLAMVMRTKSHTLVASCYLELCIINSYGVSVAAGQAMIAEAVSGLCDRIVPFQPTEAMAPPNVGRNLMDAVLGLAADTFPVPSVDQIQNFADTGLDDSGVASL
jgi:hypothetical protein